MKKDLKSIDKTKEGVPIIHFVETSIGQYEQLVHEGDDEIQKRQRITRIAKD